MKVKISYTVELEEVPLQVHNFLVEEKVQAVARNHDLLLTLVKDNHIEQAINEIHEIRIALAKYDQKLDDAQAILDGYMRARYGSNESKENLNE